MPRHITFATIAALLALLAFVAPASAQTSTPGAPGGINVDQFKLNADLRIPQRQLPDPVARALQRLLQGVGCPDWNGEDGRWGPSSAAQFDVFLSKTGQIKRYEAMKQPTVLDLKARLFKDWVPNKESIATLKSDAHYCEPAAQGVKLLVDLTERQDDTNLPDGLPEAIAKDFQRLLIRVGCPDWMREDGKWGPSSSSQFEAFLVATGQEQQYKKIKNAPLPAGAVSEIKLLFDDWKPPPDFIPTLDDDVTYCYPLPHAGADRDKETTIDVDLRAPQPNLPENLARELQTLLIKVGCPDWGGKDGKWGPSSAAQFTQFLRKTGQEQVYESMTSPTLWDIKKLFVGWIPRPDFDPTRNDKPQYCEPIPRCNLNNEIAKILNGSPVNFSIRDLFLNIDAWNDDGPKQRNTQASLFPERKEDPMADLKEKLTDTEKEFRHLFKRVVEARKPETCGLCTLKTNYEIALALGLDDITQAALQNNETVWPDAEVLRQNIAARDAIRQAKMRDILTKKMLIQIKASDKKYVDKVTKEIDAEQQTVDDLTGLIEQEQLALERLIGPIRAGLPHHPDVILGNVMDMTTCFVGDGPYIKE